MPTRSSRRSLAGDTDKAEHAGAGFPGSACRSASRRCWRAPTTRERRRLSVQLGTSRAFEDVQALRGILNSRDGLALLGTQLPGHINSLVGSCARKREGADGRSGGGEVRSVPLFARAGDEQARGALAIDPARDQGGRQRRRQAHCRDALRGRGQIVLEEVDRESPRARRRSQERPGHRGVGPAQRGPRRAARAAFGARSSDGIGVGQAAHRAPRRRLQDPHRRDRS